ncbi:alpha-protein kinase 2 [Lissotriton helveticus]
MISSSAVIEVGSFTKSVIYQRLFQYPTQRTDMRSRNEANVQSIDRPQSEHQRSATGEQSKTRGSKGVKFSAGTCPSPCPEASKSPNRNAYFMENKSESVLGKDNSVHPSPVTELPNNSDLRYGSRNGWISDECHKRETHSTNPIPISNDPDHSHNAYSRLPGQKDEDLTIYEEGDLTEPVTSCVLTTTPGHHAQCARKPQGPSRYYCSRVEYYPGSNVITANELLLQGDLCEPECSDLREGGCNGIWRGGLQEGDALAEVTRHTRDDVGLSGLDGCAPSLGLNGASDYTEATDITIGFCDSHSKRGEPEASGVQLTGRGSALQTEMVLSAGHLQNALSPVSSRSCQLSGAATAIQNDSAAIGEEGKGVRTAGKEFCVYIPHGSVEELVEAMALHELEHSPSEEISKLMMNEKPAAEEPANGSAKGKRARRSRKEDSKVCKVNSAGHASSVAAPGGQREHKLHHKGMHIEGKAGTGDNINSRHSHAEDHRSSAGQLGTEIRQTDPLTLHIEDMDMSCNGDRSNSLSNKEFISRSSKTMEAIDVNDDGDMTNRTCGSITDNTAASVVTPLEFNNIAHPTTEICKDSHTDSETSGFLLGGFAISPSYHEVDQCVYEDKCTGGHRICENPETTLIAMDFDYPLLSSLDRGSQSQSNHNKSTMDKMKNVMYIEDVSRTTQETNSPVNVMQIGNVSVIHGHEDEAKGSLSHFPTNDVGYDLTEDSCQEIHPSIMNYDHISVQIYDGDKDPDLPHNSFDNYEGVYHREPPPSSLDHHIESSPSSPKHILNIGQEQHNNGSSEDGLEEFTETSSGIETCSDQSNQTKCGHYLLPQLVVVDSSSGNLMRDSGGQLFNEIKSLLEAFSQHLEENMQRQKHQQDPFIQIKSDALTGDECQSKVRDDGSITPSRQDRTPFRDTQNLDEILKQENGEEKLNIDEIAQNNMEFSIKALMEELLLNENVLDSFSDHDNSTKCIQNELEVEPEINVDLIDGSKIQRTPNFTFMHSRCACSEPEKDNGFVEDKNNLQDPNSISIEEPKILTTSSMCQTSREQGSIAEENAFNVAKDDQDGKGEVRIGNNIGISKTYTHNVIRQVLSQSTAQPGDQIENCYRNALEPDELGVTGDQQPEHSQAGVDVVSTDSSVEVKSNTLQIKCHRDEDLKSESHFHESSNKKTPLSSIKDISESEYNKWEFSSLHSHTIGSVELLMPSVTYFKEENTLTMDSGELLLPICTSFKEKHAHTMDSGELSLPSLTSFKEDNVHTIDRVELSSPSMTSCKEEKAVSNKITSCEIPSICSSEYEFTVQEGKIVEQVEFLKGINNSIANGMSMSLCCSEVHQNIHKELKTCDNTQDASFTSQEETEYHQKPGEGKQLLEDVQPNGVECGQASGCSDVLVGYYEQDTCEKTSPENITEPKEQINESTNCVRKVILEAKAVHVPQGQIMKLISDVVASKDNQEAPQILKNKQAKKLLGRPKTKQLSCHFAEIPSEEDSELVAHAQKSTENESAASSLILQTGRKEQESDKCVLKSKFAKEDPGFTVSSEVLEQFSSYPEIKGGEEIEFNQLFFREDFICDRYFGGNLPGKISTEELHFGEGVHRKAFRSKVIYGLVPIFSPGHVCVLKVHNAVAYGTKTTDELVQRNYKLATQECYVQNTAREYAKMYAAEAEHLKDFGKVPEIIPIFLIHRLANHIPYATVEEELVGDFVKYSIRDGKEINFMRRDSEAGQKCCTFQHWVYQKTNGNLLVTDMQGVGMKLTDVGIATLAKGYKGFKGNCSISFIEQFKALHLCNKYCEMMGLQSLQKQKKPAAVKTKAPPNPSATSRKTGAGAKTKSKR